MTQWNRWAEILIGATKTAVTAAVDAAKELGVDVVKTVKKSLSAGVKGAEDIIKSLKE